MAAITLKIKSPTPLSTRALAAYMTWKQFDILLILREGVATSSSLSEQMREIYDYDLSHGGAFYKGTSTGSVYSSLRTLERRGMVTRYVNDYGDIQWFVTDRAIKSLEWLETHV